MKLVWKLKKANNFGVLIRFLCLFFVLILILIQGCAVTPAFDNGYQVNAKPSSIKANNKKLAVLVHGIFDGGHKLQPLIETLEDEGYYCFAPDLKPDNAFYGIRDLSLKLEAEINAHWGREANFAVIGFSMGGLVSRYYLQELGGSTRCHAFITISSPHHGTLLAYFVRNQGGKEMRPDSEFLKKLNSKESLSALEDLPVFSYYTPLDAVIVPAKSSEWEPANNHRFRSLLHPLMVHEKEVQQQLIVDLNTAWVKKKD